jgi:hypothetical protein
MWTKKACTLVAAVAVMGLAPASALAVTVDLELSLLIDVSGSVDSNEFDLQRSGYSGAFRDPVVIYRALNETTYGAMAVNLIYWSTMAQQAIGWTLLDSNQDFTDFADTIDATARPSSGNIGGSTGIVNAINLAYPLFDDNGYEGTRQVIDISGDGIENVADEDEPLPLGSGGDEVAAARDAALDADVDTINGLAIQPTSGYGAGQDVPLFYDTFVIGGDLPFMIETEDFDDFEGAVLDKIRREVGPVIPEPLTMAAIALGVAGLGAYVRRRRLA